MRTQLAWTFAWLSFAATAQAEPPDPNSTDRRLPDDVQTDLEAVNAPSAVALDAAREREAREPRVEQVVREALRAAPTPRADALASRARTAGWIPRIGLRARRGQTIDLSGPQALDLGAARVRSNDDLTLEASLNFELDRVVFRREEVALLHQSQGERQARERLVRDVIALYFERRRLQLERDLKGDPALERAIRVAEIEALLDAFTNGAFRRMIARSPWTTGANTAASTSPSPPKSKSAVSR